MITQGMIGLILAKKKEGKAVYYVWPNKLTISALEDLCNQPADGILYVLNRDEASILALADENNSYWVNNYATAQVIRYLKGRVEELEEQIYQKDKEMAKALCVLKEINSSFKKKNGYK